MHKPIATVGLMFLIALTGCKKTSPQPEPQVADAAPGDITELRKALKQSQAETLKWKAKAQALAAGATQASEVVEADTDDSDKPSSNSRVLTKKQSQQQSQELARLIVRVWDVNNKFWRDVQVGDYEWSLSGSGSILGSGKNEPKFTVMVRDQSAEEIVAKYCKLGKNVDGVWRH